MQPRSDFLFARPSFIEGLARIFDFGGTLNEYNTSILTDEAAAALDWAFVNAALWGAVDQQVRDYGLPRLYAPLASTKAQPSGVR